MSNSDESERPPDFTIVTIIEGAALGTVLSLIGIAGNEMLQDSREHVYRDVIGQFWIAFPTVAIAWPVILLCVATPVWRILQGAGYHGYFAASGLGLIGGFALATALMAFVNVYTRAFPGDDLTAWRCLDEACGNREPPKIGYSDVLLGAANALAFGCLCSAVGLYMRWRAAR